MNESAALLCAGGRTYVVAAALQTREWEARRQVWDVCLAHLERYKKKKKKNISRGLFRTRTRLKDSFDLSAQPVIWSPAFFSWANSLSFQTVQADNGGPPLSAVVLFA